MAREGRGSSARREGSGALEPLGQDIWFARGPTLTAFGFRFPTHMAAVRLAAGDLVIWSPVALGEALRAELGALGPVRHVIAPSTLHHLFVADWRRAYPNARFHAAPGLRDKRADLEFDDDLTDAAPSAWAGQIDQVVIRGNLITTELAFFHRASGTTLVTDLVQHFPADWFSGWRAVVAKLDLMTAPEPAVPRKLRLAFVDRRAARSAVERVLAWPTEKVLMAHGAPVLDDGQAVLRAAFRWLVP